MTNVAMETILKSAACRGAFRLKDGALAPFVQGSSALETDAGLTRDLWVSLCGVTARPALMIAKKGEALSVASAKGGVIIETSGPINLGMLRAALQNEAPVLPLLSEEFDTTSFTGVTGLWALARWIEQIEAPRAIAVTDGDVTHLIYAEKGLFGLADGQTPAKVAAQLIAAEAAGAPITLTYVAWPDTAPAIAYQPAAFFHTASAAKADWIMSEGGRLLGVPACTSLQDIARATQLVARLSAWRDESVFDVTVLRDDASREVIARSDEAGNILLNKAALGWGAAETGNFRGVTENAA